MRLVKVNQTYINPDAIVTIEPTYDALGTSILALSGTRFKVDMRIEDLLAAIEAPAEGEPA